jgi:hypothetical protein
MVGVADGNGGTASRSLEVAVLSVDAQPPTASFSAIVPSARSRSLDSLMVTFSEPVMGFDLADIALRRRTSGTTTVDLSNASLTTSDNREWTVSGLGSVTRQTGGYELTLSANGSGITDITGNALGQGVSATWIMGAGDTNLDQVFNQIDIVALLQGGKYRTGETATWSEGDWDGNGRFDQFDVIVAQQTSPAHYLAGPFGASKAATTPARTELIDAVLSQFGTALAI